MLRDLPTDQRLLADFMSELSEEAYYAGWMMDLEYALWEAVIGVRRDYGRLELSEAHCTRLRELSDNCGGWIVSTMTPKRRGCPWPSGKNVSRPAPEPSDKFDSAA
jgi:hypothetical protein